MVLVVTLSELNKRERAVRKSLADIEKDFKVKKISRDDYSRMKKEKQDELKRIDLDRKNVMTKLPPMPPPPKPGGSDSNPYKTSSAQAKTGVDFKKLEKDLLFTQSEMSKLFAEVVKNRERIKKTENDINNLNTTKDKTSSVDPKAIEEKLSAEVERMSKSFMEKDSKSSQELERMAGDMGSLKRDIEEMKSAAKVLNNLDVAGIRRDIEALKSKAQWLEKEMKNIDMEPLYDLIKEIENKISSGRIVTAPVIIE